MERQNVTLDRIRNELLAKYGDFLRFPILEGWYQEEVQRTAPGLPPHDNFETCLNLAAMGLGGEAGEVVDLVKKHQHFGMELNRPKILEEAGDVLWYLQYLCEVLQISLDDIALQNVYKLRLRYPDGFNTADSISRKDEAAPAPKA